MDVYTASSSSTEECVLKLRADPEDGLSQAEATRRLGFSGYNEFEVKKNESLFGKYLEQVCQFFNGQNLLDKSFLFLFEKYFL